MARPVRPGTRGAKARSIKALGARVEALEKRLERLEVCHDRSAEKIGRVERCLDVVERRTTRLTLLGGTR